MKALIKLVVCVLAIGVFSTAVAFSTSPSSDKSIIVYRTNPQTGKMNRTFLKLNRWFEKSFKRQQRMLLNYQELINSDRAYFIITPQSDGSIEISKRAKIKGKDVVLAMNQDLHLERSAISPNIPKEVIRVVEEKDAYNRGMFSSVKNLLRKE